MIIKHYTDYIEELHEIYPEIDIKELKKTIRMFLQKLVEALVRNDDIVLKTTGFFLGLVTVKNKKEANRYAYNKYKDLKAYRNNRKQNKKHENEQKNSNNKYIQ